MRFNTIHRALEQWGQAKRLAPPSDGAIKHRVMASLLPNKQFKTRRHFHIPWFSFGMGALAILAIVVSAPAFIRKQVFKATGAPGVPASAPVSRSQDFGLSGGATSLGVSENFTGKLYDRFYPQYDQQAPLSDTREFLKTDYSATIRSRKVEEIGQRIHIIVRGLQGRVDNSSVNNRYAYVSFVIPKTALPVLQSELKGMVYKVFFTENISTANLLPEKRNIEEQTDSTKKAMEELRSERKSEEERFRKSIAALNARVASILDQIKSVEGDKSKPDANLEVIAKLLADYHRQEQGLRSSISSLQKEQTARLAEIDSQIRAFEEQKKALEKQDSNLLETVETVRGTVQVSWIGVLEYISLLLAPHWWLWPLAALALIVAKVITRKRLPEVPLAP